MYSTLGRVRHLPFSNMICCRARCSSSPAAVPSKCVFARASRCIMGRFRLFFIADLALNIFSCRMVFAAALDTMPTLDISCRKRSLWMGTKERVETGATCDCQHGCWIPVVEPR
jgi:hypothetical protein